MNSAEESPRGERLSKGLAWFGIGLGVAEIAAPRLLARAVGIRPDLLSSVLVRAMGVREIAAGIAILMRPNRPMPIWSRVAGDILDAGLLGAGAIARRTSTARAVGALGLVAGAGILDVIAARRVQASFEASHRPVLTSVTINRPPLEVYAFYRRLDQLPLFMEYLESVQETGTNRSHWVAKLPFGKTVSWDAEIVDDRPGEAIAWESVEGSRIKTHGRVTFTKAPGRNATEVRVEMYLGVIGTGESTTLARLLAKPQVKGDLRRLKQLLETGEVLRSDASAHKKPHPAQPSLAAEPAPPIFVPNPPTATGVAP